MTFHQRERAVQVCGVDEEFGAENTVSQERVVGRVIHESLEQEKDDRVHSHLWAHLAPPSAMSIQHVAHA